MKKLIIILFLIFLIFKGYAQDFPDRLILSIEDTIICKVNMINTKNAFIVAAHKKKNGKIKPISKTIPISEVKDIILNSKPTISNRHYIKLLDKFDKRFYDLGCKVLSLEYDYINEEVIAETRCPIIFLIGVQSWIGVTTINGKKFLTITQSKYGLGFIDVLQGAKVVIHLQDGDNIELITDRNHSSINNTKLVVGNYGYFETEVIQVAKNNVLKLILPIEIDQLVKLSESKIISINIETAASEMTIKVDSDKIDSAAMGCKCGLYMK